MTPLRRYFGHDGVEQFRGGGAGDGELRFQRVHDRHQLIHFCNDAALFGEGWNRNCESTDEAQHARR